MSRRYALVAFFVVKESGPFGGVLCLVIIGAAFAVFYLPVMALVQLYCLTLSAPAKTHFKASLWMTTEDVWFEF